MGFVEQILEGLLELVQNFFVWLGGLVGVGDYGAGFLAGFVLASIGGFLVYRLNIWMRHASAAYRPQRIMQMTAQTPSQVVSASTAAIMKMTGVLVIGLTVLLLMSGLAYPPDAAITAAFGFVLLLIGVVMG